jgi:hypothetical protein
MSTHSPGGFPHVLDYLLPLTDRAMRGALGELLPALLITSSHSLLFNSGRLKGR